MPQYKKFEDADLAAFKAHAAKTMTGLTTDYIENNSLVIESTKSENQKTQFVLGSIGEGRFFYLNYHDKGQVSLASVPNNERKFK